ncbi:MAG: hypothetical protein WCB27_10205 [Thermoguttaceae bacterium]
MVAACLIGCCATPRVCRADTVEQRLEKVAADLNKNIPRQMDAVTRIDRVEAGPGRSLSYKYTISKTLTDAQKTQLKQTVTRQALNNAQMQPLFDAGVTFCYKYYDSTGKSMLEFSVSKPGTPASSAAQSPEKAAHNAAYRIGSAVGALIGGLIVGVLCGLVPLFVGIRRGRTILGGAGAVSCAAAGLALGLLLAVPVVVPVAVVFVVVILALPRVPKKAVVTARLVE